MKRNIFTPILWGFSRIILIIPFCLSLLFNSCEEPDIIGIELIEDHQIIDVVPLDFDLMAYTAKGYPAATNLSSKNILGFHNHPVFGSTRASIFAEFLLGRDSLKFGNDPVLDSVVLELYYSSTGLYGDTASYQTVKVYELLQNFPEADDNFLYYSDLEIDHRRVPLAGKHFSPALTDSLNLEGIIAAPHLRIRLSDDFGNKLLEGQDNGHFHNDSIFREYFKGLCLKVDDLPKSQEGALIYFDILEPNSYASRSRLSLYYHVINDDGKPVLLSHAFPFHPDRRTTHAEYSYEHADEVFVKQIVEGDKTYGDSLLFLQSLGGTDISITFSNKLLDSLSKMDVIINQAKLILPIEEKLKPDNLPIPNRLNLKAYNSEGRLGRLKDAANGYYGGLYNQDKNEYVIIFTQHFQELLDNPGSNYGHKLIYLDSHNYGNNLVIRGPGQSDRKLKLQISYTIID